MITLVSWNLAGRDLWADLGRSGADVALLQEARRPPRGFVDQVVPDRDGPWDTVGWPTRAFRTAIATLSDRVQLAPRPNVPVDRATAQGDWTVARLGTITAADVIAGDGTLFTAASVYAPWERTSSGGLYADASAHRLLSDLSALMFRRDHRLVVAGDWNILRGHGEHGDPYYAARYQTVFDRAAALGLRFVGPQAPDGGRQAQPWPDELPSDSRNVPTYHHSRQTPATATRQLDFVFASEALADRVTTTAVNAPERWGGSDHCQVRIEVDA